jgi:hypothetical protein
MRMALNTFLLVVAAGVAFAAGEAVYPRNAAKTPDAGAAVATTTSHAAIFSNDVYAGNHIVGVRQEYALIAVEADGGKRILSVRETDEKGHYVVEIDMPGRVRVVMK